MAGSNRKSMFDSLLAKGREALDKQMSDQEKVDKAKTRAKEKLGQHMNPDKAAKVVDKTETLLSKIRRR